MLFNFRIQLPSFCRTQSSVRFTTSLKRLKNNSVKVKGNTVVSIFSCCFNTMFLYSPIYYLYWFCFIYQPDLLLKSIMPISSAWRSDPCTNVFHFNALHSLSNVVHASCSTDQWPVILSRATNSQWQIKHSILYGHVNESAMGHMRKKKHLSCTTVGKT